MKDKKRTRLIYKNIKTGEIAEFRKPDSISYVYDGPTGKVFLNKHEVKKNWEFVPEESFFRNIRPNVGRY